MKSVGFPLEWTADNVKEVFVKDSVYEFVGNIFDDFDIVADEGEEHPNNWRNDEKIQRFLERMCSFNDHKNSGEERKKVCVETANEFYLSDDPFDWARLVALLRHFRMLDLLEVSKLVNENPDRAMNRFLIKGIAYPAMKYRRANKFSYKGKRLLI